MALSPEETAMLKRALRKSMPRFASNMIDEDVRPHAISIIHRVYRYLQTERFVAEWRRDYGWEHACRLALRMMERRFGIKPPEVAARG